MTEIHVPWLCKRHIGLHLDKSSSRNSYKDWSWMNCNVWKGYIHLPPTTRSGYRDAKCHVPWPPLECPETSTRVFLASAHGFQSWWLWSIAYNASTVPQMSRTLGPCQSYPYVKIKYICGRNSMYYTHPWCATSRYDDPTSLLTR